MTQWQAFLETHGASFNEAHIAHFESSVATEDTVLVDLSHLGLLELHGEDAVTFLQGQVTNDVKKLDGSNSHYSGYCTPKGRLLAIFLAFSNQQNIYLQFPRELLEATQKRLKMYVLRSKVTISDASDSLIHFGIAGSKATEILNAQGLTSPDAQHAISFSDDVLIMRMSGETPRFQIFTSLEKAQTLWTAVSSSAKVANKDYWDYLEILAGIPEIVAATQEEFVPQMVNLDAIGGISFKKGCYTGQEIVARTHYLGKVKRRTYIARINAPLYTKAGADISTNAGDIVGKVVRSSLLPSGENASLIELRQEAIQNKIDLFWESHALSTESLPYAIPE